MDVGEAPLEVPHEAERRPRRRVPAVQQGVDADLGDVPFRGKPNEPAYVRYVAEEIARIKNQPLALIARQTSANFFSRPSSRSV